MGTCVEVAVFKCRKCRHILFTDVNVVSGHSEPFQADSITNGLSCDNKSVESVWFLQEENVTDWMKEQLNNGEWIKGKIFCPKCFGRIGSFDFVSGSHCPCKQMLLPSLHVVRSKVDCEPVRKKSIETEGSPNCSSPSKMYTGTDSFDLSEKDWKEDIIEHDLGNEYSLPDLPLNDDFIEYKTKLRKQQGGKCKTSSPNSCTSGLYSPSSEDSETMPFEVFGNLVCPICLDIYLSPFTCQPCGHVFCEVCLRKIAKPKPTHTYCPICRQLIGQCELNREISEAVRSQYPKEYKARLREEDKDCRCFPLPWNSKYHSGMHSFGMDFDCDTDHAPRANWWSFFSAQQQTFAILLSLKIISAVMFFLGFFGGSYATTLLKYLASFAPQIFQEILEASLRSNETDAD